MPTQPGIELIAYEYLNGDSVLPRGGIECAVVDAEPTTELRDLLSTLPSLRLLLALSAGTEKWEKILPPGVDLANARGAHSLAVVEWVLAVVLNHLRDLRHYQEQQRHGTWSPRVSDSIQGRRVVVAGGGAIGLAIERTLKTLGADVKVLGGSSRNPLTSGFIASEVRLCKVLIVSLPHNASTVDLINEQVFSALENDALVVNVGRGSAITTPALLHWLEVSRGWAFLDVIQPEPLPAHHPLWQHPRAFVSPHVAGMTQGRDRRAWEILQSDIVRFFAGEKLENLVTRRPSAW